MKTNQKDQNSYESKKAVGTRLGKFRSRKLVSTILNNMRINAYEISP